MKRHEDGDARRSRPVSARAQEHFDGQHRQRSASAVPLDAPATLETIDPLRKQAVVGADARCVILLGRPGGRFFVHLIDRCRGA